MSIINVFINIANLDKLRGINFGVMAADGGMHMVIFVRGKVYEVHWSHDSKSHDLYEYTDMKDWKWKSGAIMVPPEELANWGRA